MTKPKRPTVRIMPGSYYPTKQELEEDVSIGGTPEELVAAVLRSVRIVREPDAWRGNYRPCVEAAARKFSISA